MIDGLDATKIRIMAEFVRQILPVCAVFAGVTLAVVFVHRGTGDGGARDRVVYLLTKSSVSMICAICASALFLIHFDGMGAAWSHTAESGGLSERLQANGMDRLLESYWVSLLGLWAVAISGASYGVFLALRALGMSGFMRSESEGKRTRRLMVTALVVIVLCYVLFVASSRIG